VAVDIPSLGPAALTRRGGVEEWHERSPAALENGYERGWRDHRREPARRPLQPPAIATGGPRKEPWAEDETGLPVTQDERAVRESLVRRFVEAALSGPRDEALGVELIVNGIGPVLASVKL
jgi:hypothetical protein